MRSGNPASKAFLSVCALALAVLLASCKKGVDHKDMFSIGGNVSGMAGTGLVLQNNGGDNLTHSSNGKFTFAKQLERGSRYKVTVLTPPSGQACAVTNGEGTVRDNVNDVAVSCSGGAATIGGTVSGLAGAGLAIQNNGGDTLSVSANGAFTFATPMASGASYSVTVLTQPGFPAQTCNVTNGNGTANASVSNVAVDCTTNTYSIGGTVSGLGGAGLVLQNNGGDNLSVGANGVFTFATPVASGGSYSVSVFTQPSSQVCSVGNGSGPVTSVEVSEITVSCIGAVAPSAGPTVSLAFGLKELQFSWTAVSGASFYRLMEDPDGVSGFTQVGADITTLSVSHAIPVHLRLNAKYIVQACNSVGCVDSAPTASLGTNLTQAIGYFKASNTGGNDQFGFAVALSSDGNTLAVGARNEASGAVGINGTPDDSAGSAGAVYVFARTASGWAPQAFVKASNAAAGDQFGSAVALSSNGSTLAVGSVFQAGSGAVYVFTRSGTTWSEQALVKADNAGTNDVFGNAVALSGDGNTLAVGAPFEDSNTTGVGSIPSDPSSSFNAGAVYVFTRSGSAWSQQAYVKASNSGQGDAFGISVALSGDGDTLAVGANSEDSSTTGIDSTPSDPSASFNAGAAYVFTRSASAWSQQAYVKAFNTGSGDQFGMSVALSGDGNLLAVGAPLEDSNTTGIDSTPSDPTTSFNAGAVYLFARSGATWSAQAYVKPSDARQADQFGASVALSSDGNTLAVGAPLEDLNSTGVGGVASALENDSGTVYVFTRGPGNWSERAHVKASNTGAGDRFGTAVAVSGDGTTLAVGAQMEDGSSTGIGGTQSDNGTLESGAVYLY